MIAENFSLLYPLEISSDQPSVSFALNSKAQHDLEVKQLVAAFTSDPEYQKEVWGVFSQLLYDPGVIAYRLDVIDDLLRNPRLVERFASLLPVIDALAKNSYRSEQEINSLHEVTWRIGELQSIIDCVEQLGELFRSAEGGISSQGLCSLQDEVQKIQNHPTYQNLVRELPEVLAKLRACASITIGVNLDASLRPVQATLLSINDKPFTDQSLLNKLFGIKGDQEGIAPLHTVPQRTVTGQYAFPVSPELGWAVKPMLVPLFADLAIVLEKATTPIAKQLKQYAEIQGGLFIHLRQGLIFYLGAVRLIEELQKQALPVCRPQIAPPAERVCEVEAGYNAKLVLQHARTASETNPVAITTNDINIGPAGRILILTGPNQGGKTTYMVGVGIIQVLAQVGCYVPGRQARISPVDHLFTHFPVEEKPETDSGRLGEEALRLAKIFEQVTQNSLVLLNESFSSTSSGESLYLAKDIVLLLRRIGARAIYSTHLHELAGRAGEINELAPGDSRVISIVSSPVAPDASASGEEIRRTYKIEVRPPLGQSYAREIAARYGINYEQLEILLSKRGVL